MTAVFLISDARKLNASHDDPTPPVVEVITHLHIPGPLPKPQNELLQNRQPLFQTHWLPTHRKEMCQVIYN